MMDSGFAPFVVLTAIFALMLTGLAFAVSMRRFALKGVTIGDGGDEILRRRVRIHGNFAEYAPAMLLCVLALHLAGWSDSFGWVAAAGFLTARVSHAVSMPDDSRTALRIFAMVLQHATFAVVTLALFWAALV